MAIGCGAKCAKAMLIIFNLLFWLAGGAILSIGIWLVVDSNTINAFNVVHIDPSDPMIKYAAYLFIAVGAFIVLVAFLGCCGAMQESKCMLVTYFLILLLIFVGLLAAGILAIVYREKVTESLNNYLETSLTEKYGQDDSITKAWDYFQFTEQCCGYNTHEDYNRVKNWKKRADQRIPDSCCYHTKDSNYLKIIPVKADECQKRTPNMFFAKGCHQYIIEQISKASSIMIGLAFGIAGLVIFGMIFSICLCRNIGQEVYQ